MNWENLLIAYHKYAFMEQENRSVKEFLDWVKGKIKFTYEFLISYY